MPNRLEELANSLGPAATRSRERSRKRGKKKARAVAAPPPSSLPTAPTAPSRAYGARARIARAAAAIDYAYWDKTAAEFAHRKEFKAKRRTVLVAGAASERARQNFEKAGWQLRSGLRG